MEIRCNVEILAAGFCTHLEYLVVEQGRFEIVNIPSLFGVIQHPSFGIILFDTGYSPALYRETATFPNRFYAMVTPTTGISESTSAKVQLETKFGISAEEVKYIFISHFHGDHISGLEDFPQATFVYLEEAYEAIKNLNNYQLVMRGVLRNLFPKDFVARSKPISLKSAINFSSSNSDIQQMFGNSFDFFGDGSLVVVALPGHCCGHMGLIVKGFYHQPFKSSSSFLNQDSNNSNATISSIHKKDLQSHQNIKSTNQYILEKKETDVIHNQVILEKKDSNIVHNQIYNSNNSINMKINHLFQNPIVSNSSSQTKSKEVKEGSDNLQNKVIYPQDFFFVGDAVWFSKTFEALAYPHWITRLLVHDNWNDYVSTIKKLHSISKLHPSLWIIPSHCPKVWSHVVQSSKNNVFQSKL